MNKVVQNGFKKHPECGVFVLDGYTSDDVSRAMIENCYQKEPFYIFDMDEAYNRIQHFKQMMPRVQIFYAMKSNDSEMMLKLAIALGLGFDCASPGEIFKIRQFNVCPKSIIYAMPTKTPEQMVYARQTGVQHTTFDSSYELKKLKEFWPDAKALIRIRINSDCQIDLGEKFGCDFETEAIDLLEEAASLGLKVVGVAFHVGYLCTSKHSYIEGLMHARSLFDHEARAGRKMTIVDFGGGFLGDRTDRIDQVSKLINSALEELFPDPSVQVIAEPGTYLCNSSFTLFCNISNVRRIKDNENTRKLVYLNDGVYGNLRYTEQFHAPIKFRRLTERDVGELEEVILWGPSCDSTDRVMKDYTVHLPGCMALDWLIFNNHGAYTLTCSTRFSSQGATMIRHIVSLELWEKLKDAAIFQSTHFIMHPDISSPLPSTLPPVLPNNKNYEHPQTPNLTS